MLVTYEPTPKLNIGKVKTIEYLKTEVTESNQISIVQDIKYPENIIGKTSITYVNLDTKEVFYEYIDRPLTPEEEVIQLKAQVKSLEDTILKTQGVI